MRGFLFFVLIVVGLDQALGFGLSRAYQRMTADERVGLINYALQQDPDVLVLGSSRAAHHVVPSILRVRLSASVYNAGSDGHDFLYAAMLLDLWSRSNRPPRIIIVHMDPSSLSYSEEEMERTSAFAPYFYQSEAIRRILLMRGKYERLKYLSSAYRFNGKVFPMIRNLSMGASASFDGYVGLEGTIDVAPGFKRSEAGNPRPPWDVKLEYLAEIVQYCRENGIRLFLITSPQYFTNHASAVWSAQMSQLVASYPGVTFLDLSERTHPELFAERPDLFMDGTHLNSKGAEVFSALLGNEIAESIESDTEAPRNR